MTATGVPRRVFVTGGSGYIGRALCAALLGRGHSITALVRPGSADRLAPGCEAVEGDPLNIDCLTTAARGADCFVQLLGTPHPHPGKAARFLAVDLVSINASVAAAKQARVDQFVYVSVAHPAPVMRVYIDVRRQGEAAIRAAGLQGAILRPWYVLGPGHRWPVALKPAYRLLEWLPATRDTALRLGLVTLTQLVAALVHAVETPWADLRVMEVPAIRAAEALT